jgi:hypothetical protein
VNKALHSKGITGSQASKMTYSLRNTVQDMRGSYSDKVSIFTGCKTGAQRIKIPAAFKESRKRKVEESRLTGRKPKIVIYQLESRSKWNRNLHLTA